MTMATSTQHLGAFVVTVVRVFVEMMRDTCTLCAEEESSFASAGDVKGGEAGTIVALNASAHLVSAEVAL